MRSVIEQDIEDKVLEWAKPRHILMLKLNLMGNTGWPDRQFLYMGRSVFIEFKRPGEPLRRNQPARVRKLRQMGFTVGVFDNVADSTNFLEATILSSHWRQTWPEPSMFGTTLPTGWREDLCHVYDLSYLEG